TSRPSGRAEARLARGAALTERQGPRMIEAEGGHTGRHGRIRMGLYGGRPARDLTLSDAIMTGFRMATKVNFVIPILIIGVIVNVIVYSVFVPFLVGLVAGKTTDGTAIGGALPVGIISAVIAGSIGGVLLNLYGQVWATLASAGPEPTIQATFARISQRWTAILGAGIVVAAVGLGLFIVGGALAAALGSIGVSCSSSRSSGRSTSAHGSAWRAGLPPMARTPWTRSGPHGSSPRPRCC
ncbi:MAG: hypothetical protein ABIV26_09190, partial [Candidatus Limnocylindrales bacterium]